MVGDFQKISVRVPKNLESAYVQEGIAALLYHGQLANEGGTGTDWKVSQGV